MSEKVEVAARGPAGLALTAAPPVFVFGFERSGTTLISMMLGAHPELAVPLTVTGLWYRYARRLSAYEGLATPDALARLVGDLLAEERIRLWDVRLDRDELLAGLAGARYPDVVRRFHEAYAGRKGKPRWGNLDIATLDDLDLAHAWFPDARFVHIVRDGRDVALSHETMPYGAATTLECAERWRHRLTVNLKMGAILGPERYLVVRYEDLVLEAPATLARICRFIGLEYSAEMLGYTRMVGEKVPADRRWLWPALDQPPDPSKAFAWKRRMGTAKRLVFEDVAGDLLGQLGYERPPAVSKTAGRYAYEVYCFLNRGGRFRRLAARVGFRRRSQLERRWRRKERGGDP